MNRRDVRALGWVVTRDTFSEVIRTALGRRPKMPIAAFRQLGARWRAIRATDTAEGIELFDALPVERRPAEQTRVHEKAVIAFVESLQTFRPDLYAERALRNRCWNGVGQVVLSLAFGAILASWTSADTLLVSDAALILFAIASWSVVATIQLWRTHRLIRRSGQCRSEPCPVPERSSPPPADRGLPHP
jgi:hypothetical protein